MSTLVTYKAVDGGNVQEVSPDPVAPALGGLALNTNFRAIADSLPRNNYGASTNPTPDNDSVDTAGIGVDFSKGSRWYNGTAIFECVDPTPTAAVWVRIIENVAGTINLLGATLNANNGSGSGGGMLDMDGGNVSNLGTITAGTWHGSLISGTYGGTGVNNGNSTITLGGNLTTSGAHTTTLTTTANTSLTLPTSGALLTTTGSGASLTGIPVPTLSAVAAAGASTSIQLTLSGGVNTNGSNVLLNYGTIDLGQDFSSNHQTISFDPVGSAVNFNFHANPLNLNGATINGDNGSGSGGGTLNMDGGNLNMGGGNLNMGGGTIVRLRADNQSVPPSSPSLGQIYYDTTSNHFYGWNGTFWMQLDN